MGETPSPGLLKLSRFDTDNKSVTAMTILAYRDAYVSPAAPQAKGDVDSAEADTTADADSDVDAPTEMETAPAPSPEAVDSRLTLALETLARRAGPSGKDLPGSLGRPLLRLEGHLADGPIPVEPGVGPLELAMLIDRLLRSAAAVHDLLVEEMEVLGEALEVDLSLFPLTRLQELADALLGLSMAPRSAAAWGRPDAAQAAETVLQVAAEDLRASAREHATLYRRYTEYVWDVPTHLLQAGQHRWRFVSRTRLARQLRAVSRTDRFPRGLTAAAKEILEVRAVRARLVSMSPLLTHHLAELDQGPLSDVDAALAAVGAVRRLQCVLGDAIVPDRLERLLLAEAFASPDVLSPAVNLRNAILAWHHDLSSLGGEVSDTLVWSDLALWAEACGQLLPSLREGQAAAARLGISVATLPALADLLLLREHVEDLVTAEAGADPAGGAA